MQQKMISSIKKPSRLLKTRMEFPIYFSSLYDHMVLIPSECNTYFNLMPPNQNDWQFTLTKIGDNKWVVHGVKEPCFTSDTTEVIKIYEYVNDAWVCI
jgi:hypothetical protein